ncbi:hypothetical protein BV22DRAFT_421631 [Leucogyrophana mollusca]|uniref:Uncharacterized protein n=1 Tax=Leucogyrophana mollusca TaxID=85980 RepID=A0ACB8BJ65_9AGAM|nr:hypothetical protein BV22DRAFT_421631 [Leucogyrophana mollusca]
MGTLYRRESLGQSRGRLRIMCGGGAASRTQLWARAAGINAGCVSVGRDKPSRSINPLTASRLPLHSLLHPSTLHPQMSPVSSTTPTGEWVTPPTPTYMSSVQEKLDWCDKTLSNIARLCVLANLDQDMINIVMDSQEELVAVHKRLSYSGWLNRWSRELLEHVDSCFELSIELEKLVSRTSRLRLQRVIPTDEPFRSENTCEPAAGDSGRLSPIITEFEQKPKPSANSPSSPQYLLGSRLNPIPPPAFTPRPRADDQDAPLAAPEQHRTRYDSGIVMNGGGPVIGETINNGGIRNQGAVFDCIVHY